MKLLLIFSLFIIGCGNGQKVHIQGCVILESLADQNKAIPVLVFCNASTNLMELMYKKRFVLDDQVVRNIGNCANENSDTSLIAVPPTYKITILYGNQQKR